MIRIECSDAVAVVPQLLDEARLVWPTVRGVGRINEGTADARLCLYLPDGHAPVTSDAWAAVVAAHVPAPEEPPADPIEAFSNRLRGELPAATTLAKLRASLISALDELDAARGS